MKALVKTGKGEAEVREIERPDDGTLVETLRVGIDGTDREVMEESSNVMPDDYMVMGHEAVGRVVESRKFEEGQLVVPQVRRPTCGCVNLQEGRPDFCPPGHYVERGIEGAHGYCSKYFAERDPDYLVPVPGRLEELGVLVEPTSIVEKAVDQVERAQERLVYEPEKALVLGAGSIGLLASMLFRMKGLEVRAVDVVERGHPKAGILDDIGAEYVDNRETDISELEQPDLVLEASGVSKQIFDAIELLAPNGALVSVGLPRDSQASHEIETGKVHGEMVLKNKLYLGSVNSALRHFEEAIGHLDYFRQNFPVERILDLQASLDNWERAFGKPDIKGEIVFD